MKFIKLFALVVLTFSAGLARADNGAQNWYSFDLNEVPAIVLEAAKEAKPGVVLQKQKLTWRSDEGVYILVGRYYGAPYRFNVSTAGKVISVVELDRR